MYKYSYSELYELIKEEVEIEKGKKMKDEKRDNMNEIYNQGIRMINNPTIQNLNKTIKILRKDIIEKEEKIDNRDNYIYKSF